VHVASSCPLAANGSVLDFNFAVVFNKNPLVCYDPDARRFVPCDWGLLHKFAASVASKLNNDTAWGQRAEARRQACHQLATHFWSSTAWRRSEPPGWGASRGGDAAVGAASGVLCQKVARGRWMGTLDGDVGWGRCMETLDGDVAWGCCMGTLGGDVGWGRCMGTLDGDVGWGRCTGMLHGDVGWGRCTGMLHGDVGWGCCMGTLDGDVAWGRCTGTLDGDVG